MYGHCQLSQSARFVALDSTQHHSMRSFAKPDFPKLPDKLREELRAITPSMDGDLTYWPCAAPMRDGTILLCVYIAPEGLYIKHWGVYPRQDRGKSYVSLSDS